MPKTKKAAAEAAEAAEDEGVVDHAPRWKDVTKGTKITLENGDEVVLGTLVTRPKWGNKPYRVSKILASEGEEEIRVEVEGLKGRFDPDKLTVVKATEGKGKRVPKAAAPAGEGESESEGEEKGEGRVLAIRETKVIPISSIYWDPELDIREPESRSPERTEAMRRSILGEETQIQPILVKPLEVVAKIPGIGKALVGRMKEAKAEFLGCAGKTRWTIMAEEGFTEIKAEIDTTTLHPIRHAFSENTRLSYTPVERARAIQRLMESGGPDGGKLTQTEVAKIMGISQPYVSEHLMLLDCPKSWQDGVASGRLTMKDVRRMKQSQGKGEDGDGDEDDGESKPREPKTPKLQDLTTIKETLRMEEHSVGYIKSLRAKPADLIKALREEFTLDADLVAKIEEVLPAMLDTNIESGYAEGWRHALQWVLLKEYERVG